MWTCGLSMLETISLQIQKEGGTTKRRSEISKKGEGTTRKEGGTTKKGEGTTKKEGGTTKRREGTTKKERGTTSAATRRCVVLLQNTLLSLACPNVYCKVMCCVQPPTLTRSALAVGQ